MEITKHRAVANISFPTNIQHRNTSICANSFFAQLYLQNNVLCVIVSLWNIIISLCNIIFCNIISLWHVIFSFFAISWLHVSIRRIRPNTIFVRYHLLCDIISLGNIASFFFCNIAAPGFYPTDPPGAEATKGGCHIRLLDNLAPHRFFIYISTARRIKNMIQIQKAAVTCIRLLDAQIFPFAQNFIFHSKRFF